MEVFVINKDVAERLENLFSYSLIYGCDGICSMVRSLLKLGKYRESDVVMLDRMIDIILFKLNKDVEVYPIHRKFSGFDYDYWLAYNNLISLKRLL